jgi:hypothetical protein
LASNGCFSGSTVHALSTYAKIIKNKRDYHKILINVLDEEKVEFYTYQPRQQRAYRMVIRNLHHSEQQELVIEEFENIEHKIRNLWNIRHRVTGYPLSLFVLDIEPAGNNEIYHIEYLQNMTVQIEPPHRKIIITYRNARGVKLYYHTKEYYAYRPRCVKCGRSHSTE